MRLNDFLYLSGLNLKAKKSTKLLIIGLVFSLTILSIIVFMNFSIKNSINKKINASKSVSSINVKLTSERILDNSIDCINTNYYDSLLSLKGIEKYINYYQYNINNSSQKTKFILNNQELIINKNFESYYEEGSYTGLLDTIGFNVIDNENSTTLFLDADYEASVSPLLYGNTFSSDSKGEIMLNSALFDAFNLDASNYIGTTISITSYFNSCDDVYTDQISKPNSFTDKDITLINNFKIVGIYDKNIYKSQIRSTNNNKVSNSLFWITTDSINLNDEYSSAQVVQKTYRGELRDYFYLYHTKEEYEEYCFNNKLMFLPFKMAIHYIQTDYNNFKHYKDSAITIQFDSYDTLWKNIDKIEELYISSSSFSSSSYIQPWYLTELYKEYSSFYPIYYYTNQILIYIGIICLIICLMNLFNVMYHDIFTKESYYAMMRSMGLCDKDIVKLYFVEIGRIFLRSLIITLVLGFSISIVLTKVINNVIFKLKDNDILTIDISINYWYYIPSFIFIMIGCLIIIFIFAGLMSSKIKKKNISEIISEQ